MEKLTVCWQNGKITETITDDLKKLTVKYTSEEIKIYVGTAENIDALIRELRNNKSTYYWYIIQ